MHVANVANRISQKAYNFEIKGNFNDKILVKGSCLLNDVVTSNNTTDFSVTDRYPISPDTIPSTRLHALSKLYYNYIFKKIKLRYRTKQPTTRDGQVGIFFYDDPGEMVNDVPISGYLLESMILEAQLGEIQPVYSNFTVDYHGKPFRPYYRCSGQGGEIQECIQTNICFASERPTVPDLNSPSYSLGYVEMEYELEFSKPKSLRPYSDAQLRPNYNLIIGTGALNTDNSGMYAAWEISNDTLHGSNWADFQGNPGIYIITFNEAMDNTNPWQSWSITPYQGISYFMKVEYVISPNKVKFTIYSDWSSVVSDSAMRSGTWKTQPAIVNMHRITRFFDVSLNAGVASRKSLVEDSFEKVVKPETVSNVINQRVFVDPKYIETISPHGQSRNLSSYL